MRYDDLADFLRHVGKDPSTLIFEDDLTGIHNRRFLLSYLEHKVRWASGEDYPLSLLFLDLDGFKDVNDTHGHETGDQVLIWTAGLLSDVAGEDGLPVRYGGDEFMLVLPGVDRAAARGVTDRLLQRVLDGPFEERDSGTRIPMTLSVGVASAPEDAAGRAELVNAADAALYFAKQSGRNQAAIASEIDQAAVFSHTALQRLKASGICGRDEELNLVDHALRAVTQGRSQVLVFEGAPGVGKTTLLETVRRNLKADGTFRVTKVTGEAREASRPYYLVTRILISLLNQREDGGAGLLAGLTAEERSHLAHVLPGLVEEEVPPEIDRSTRQAIFECITRFLRGVVDASPVILLVDDFQFADEATLALLSTAAKRGDLTFVLCATVGESLGAGTEFDSSPAGRFLAEPPEEIEVQRASLTPLKPSDVAEYLRGVFPNLRMPEGFETDLAEVTSGNPFFLSEIVRNLLDDGKVQLVDQQWVVEPVDVSYLARSLEEIVTEKIAALDQQDREILERASALGEEIPLSILTGSSELDEASVQAFLDRAENMGLISLDFQVNDEVMHFLGKRILDISYAAIDEDRRRELHEELGQYQERLYEQRLLPSASMLAYHFRRSANEAKAKQYERITQVYTESVFESSEVAGYGTDQEIDFGDPLDEHGVALIPTVLRMMLSAVRNIQLYPEESEAISGALQRAKEAIDAVLAESERLTFTHSDGVLSANGEELDLSEFKVLLSAILDLFMGAELRAVSIARGVRLEELRALLTAIGSVGTGTLEQDFWSRTASAHGFDHVELRQMRYSRVVDSSGGDAATAAAATREDELTAAELALIPGLLKDFLKAAADIRLYAIGSDRANASLDGLLDSVREVVGGRPAVTMSRVDALLLVNGARVDATQWRAVSSAFVEFLDSLDLNSISFMEGVSRRDLEGFFGGLSEASPGEREKGFWEVFAADRGLTGIAFNQEDYSLGLIRAAVLGSGTAPTGGVPGGGSGAPPGQQPGRHATQATGAAQPAMEDGAPVSDAHEAAVPVAKDLLLEGKHDEVVGLLQSMFAGFSQREVTDRVSAVETCSRIFHQVVLGLQHEFSELALDTLSAAMTNESEPVVLEELAALLYEMAASAIQFSDYRLAARVYNVVDTRRQHLRGQGQEGTGAYAALTAVLLDDRTQQLLMDDLRSGRTDRQSRASLAIGHLGTPAVRLLIDVVEQERDLRVRQLAARLLAELGAEAAEELKETLLTEVLLEHRYRVLEIIDIVTQDLRTELVFSVADDNPKIRRAAFQLFERLRRDDLIDVVLPLAKGDDPGLAKGAIRSLAILETPRAAQALTDILRSATQPALAVACCKALGRLKAEGAVEALQNIMSQKKLGLFGHRWDEDVRAVAAVALRQIGSTRAAAVLAEHSEDDSMRIQAITGATAGSGGEQPSAGASAEEPEGESFGRGDRSG